MKKFLTVAILFFGLSLGLSAQECHHAKASSEKASTTFNSAEEAAAADASIVKKVNLSTGETYYVRKEVCASSGKVSFAKVEFCNKSKKFTNVSPSEQEACCAKSAKTATSSESSANAVKAATSETKPACCASKANASSSSCCAGKANTTSCGAKAEASSKPVETSSLAPKAKTVSQEQE